VNGDSCVIGVMVDGNVCVQCMMGDVVHGWCAVVVSGNQIHDTHHIAGYTVSCYFPNTAIHVYFFIYNSLTDLIYLVVPIKIIVTNNNFKLTYQGDR